MYSIQKGYPKLGCSNIEDKMNFAIFSMNAYKMLLKIYVNVEDDIPTIQIILDREHFATGDIFHVQLSDIGEGYAYSWQTLDKQEEVSVPLLDPYALSVKAFPKGSNSYRNIVVKSIFIADKRPCIPWEETIIYELHVGAFTKDVSFKREGTRGTFKGLEERLPYLKDLGITTLELLPVFKWNRYTLRNLHPLTGEVMQDVWGYNSISFFALEDRYSSNQNVLGEMKEFKAFIEAAHKQGLEVILDVVYNHSGEGGDGGTVFNFKALANEVYYRLNAQGQYMNCSGTGNTLNTAHIVVKQLVLDSLRYWVVNFGIDGFRFDLASILAQDTEGRWTQYSLLKEISEDPILSKVKLISESWDAKGSYDVGRMPYPFMEWSDYFRDTIRKWSRGELGLTKAISSCILGEEVYHTDARKKTVHFMTAHDGFTLWDLVSYIEKHNLLNGEENRDGNNANYSDNCGFEGETEDATIITLRKRRVKNYLAILFLSRGIPMIVMGDEWCRSQQGNNNAFCQDIKEVWFDWEKNELKEEILNFTKRMTRLRKESDYLTNGKSDAVISWHGVNYNEPDWSYYSRSIAWHVQSEKEEYFIIANQYVESLTFELPPTLSGWIECINTYEDTKKWVQKKIVDTHYTVPPFSMCVFKKFKI